MARLILAGVILGLLSAPCFAQQSGAALYGEACASCHGADGKGLNGPNLTALVSAGPH